MTNGWGRANTIDEDIECTLVREEYDDRRVFVGDTDPASLGFSLSVIEICSLF